MGSKTLKIYHSNQEHSGYCKKPHHPKVDQLYGGFGQTKVNQKSLPLLLYFYPIEPSMLNYSLMTP